MSRGQFEAQINTAWEVISKLGLGGERVWYPNAFDRRSVTLRALTYREVWESCFRNHYYNFMLVDNALIQFRVYSYRPLKVSYAFFDCPFDAVSYEEFIQDLEPGDADIGDYFRKDYDDYLSTCGLKETVTPIRYDYDPDSYTQGVHPVSHIHFGYGNNIRVGTARILKPLSFMLFVIRQCYVPCWKMLLDMSEAETWRRNIREALEQVGDDFLSGADHWEMRLE